MLPSHPDADLALAPRTKLNKSELPITIPPTKVQEVDTKEVNIFYIQLNINNS